jgi:hypothetical protein
VDTPFRATWEFFSVEVGKKFAHKAVLGRGRDHVPYPVGRFPREDYKDTIISELKLNGTIRRFVGKSTSIIISSSM